MSRVFLLKQKVFIQEEKRSLESERPITHQLWANWDYFKSLIVYLSKMCTLLWGPNVKHQWASGRCSVDGLFSPSPLQSLSCNPSKSGQKMHRSLITSPEFTAREVQAAINYIWHHDMLATVTEIWNDYPTFHAFPLPDSIGSSQDPSWCHLPGPQQWTLSVVVELLCCPRGVEA